MDTRGSTKMLTVRDKHHVLYCVWKEPVNECNIKQVAVVKNLASAEKTPRAIVWPTCECGLL